MPGLKRTVDNNLFVSNQYPVIQIRIDPSFAYVGGLSFIMDDATHVEQYHFVVADEAHRVQRLLWFQFEGFFENNQRSYKYDITDTLALAHLDFLYDFGALNIDDDYRERPNSDSAHVVDFLKENCYLLTGDSMFERLVWLTLDKRNELMIIYSEDLQPTGHKVGDLTESVHASANWITLAEGLHERAMASFKVLGTNDHAVVK